MRLALLSLFCFFFFNDTATTEIYTLSLHDALPISRRAFRHRLGPLRGVGLRRHAARSEEHTSELQSHSDLVCRLLLETESTERLAPRPDHSTLLRARQPAHSRAR